MLSKNLAFITLLSPSTLDLPMFTWYTLINKVIEKYKFGGRKMIDKSRDFSVNGVALPIELENNSEVIVTVIRRIVKFVLGIALGVTMGYIITIL